MTDAETGKKLQKAIEQLRASVNKIVSKNNLITVYTALNSYRLAINAVLAENNPERWYCARVHADAAAEMAAHLMADEGMIILTKYKP